MIRYRVLPYKQGSKAAKALADAIGGKVLKLVGSGFKCKPDDIVINWGNSSQVSEMVDKMTSHLPEPDNVKMFNWMSHTLKSSTDKLNFFNLMKHEHPDLIPEFWTNKEDITNDKYPIVCRTILNGHSGAGIVIANGPDDLVVAPLYVRYIKKQEEYRVHVGKQADSVQTIAVQRKARKLDCENPNWRVRNLAGGFVFTREGFVVPDSVTAAARQALETSGLDFGAVDVIWNSHQGKAYVLEINTAPGLEGQTVQDYANFFKGVDSS